VYKIIIKNNLQAYSAAGNGAFGAAKYLDHDHFAAKILLMFQEQCRFFMALCVCYGQIVVSIKLVIEPRIGI
jgi:hypothetical protein